MISTVTGAEISGELLDAEYWWHNVRKPVRFRQAVESALAAGARCFLELSPRPLLLGATNETARSLDIDAAALHTLSEADDGLEVDPMVATFARMVANGAHAPGPDLVGFVPRLARAPSALSLAEADLPRCAYQRAH